jgi:hypothetical protein
MVSIAALHESGHVLLALRNGWTARSVEVEGPWHGRTRMFCHRRFDHPARGLEVIVAGLVAESGLQGCRPPASVALADFVRGRPKLTARGLWARLSRKRCDGDYVWGAKLACRILSVLRPGPSPAAAACEIIREAEKRVALVLAGHWGGVLRLARELDRRRPRAVGGTRRRNWSGFSEPIRGGRDDDDGSEPAPAGARPRGGPGREDRVAVKGEGPPRAG